MCLNLDTGGTGETALLPELAPRILYYASERDANILSHPFKGGLIVEMKLLSKTLLFFLTVGVHGVFLHFPIPSVLPGHPGLATGEVRERACHHSPYLP